MGARPWYKVPGDVPLARIYFFRTSYLAKGIRFGNVRLGKGMLLTNIWSKASQIFVILV